MECLLTCQSPNQGTSNTRHQKCCATEGSVDLNVRFYVVALEKLLLLVKLLHLFFFDRLFKAIVFSQEAALF